VWLSLISATAAPAVGAAARTIVVTLGATGAARWSSDGVADTARLTLSYRWNGRFTFSVPARGKFTARAATTLRAGWSGRSSGTGTSGSYRCTYRGADVPGRVTATLSNGTRGSLQLVLGARDSGFFSSQGNTATVSCTSRVGARGPTHFEPEWLFRDSLQDHGRFSSDTAVLVVPSRLLPHGSVTVGFPREAGTVAQPLRPRLTWRNSGRVTLSAR
jgi:hypothetical protein